MPVRVPRGEVRVVVLTQELAAGGRARSAVDLAIGLARLGYHSTCLAHPRLGVPEAMRHRLSEAGAELRLLRFPGIRSLYAVGRVVLGLRASRPDVVIIHSKHPVGTLALLKSLYGDPRLIYTPVSFGEPAGRHKLLERAAAQIDLVACASHAVATHFHEVHPGWDPERIVVAYPGVETPGDLPSRAELRQRLGLPQEAALVGSVGRLTWSKGHDYLIAALPIILESRPDARLVLAGDGPHRGALERQATQMGLLDRVHFLGWREDIHHVLGALDVFVHPTLYETLTRSGFLARWRRLPLAPSLAGEGFGRAVAEAAACGVPVVATDAGAHRELVAHGQTGFLVPVAEHRPIGEAVAYLLRHPEPARAMGEAARARARAEFSLAAFAGRFDRLIQGLLAEKAEP